MLDKLPSYRLCLAAVALLGAPFSLFAQAFDWSDHIVMVAYNQWVFARENGSETLRFEILNEPYFRISFQRDGLDYRDTYQLTPDGIYWISSYLKESGMGALSTSFGAGGQKLSPALLNPGVAEVFNISATADYIPEGGNAISVSVTFAGTVRSESPEMFFFRDQYFPVTPVQLNLQFTVSGGVSYTRNIFTELFMMDGVGPLHAINKSTSSFPPWIEEWFLGSLPISLPSHGTGLWSNIPPQSGSTRKMTGIGLIDDSNFPVIYHFGEGSFMIVNTDLTTSLTNIWLWSLKDHNWVWTSDLLLGWHYRMGGNWQAW